MKKRNLYVFRGKQLVSFTATAIFLSVGLALLLGKEGDGRASNTLTSYIYVPLIHSNARQAPVPSLVASIPLEGARCPNDMSFNKFSGLLYVANEESDNITVIRDQSFANNIPTGKWPKYVASDPKSDRVYVSNVWSGISILNGSEITGHVPGYGESYFITVNSINDYTYVTDLHRPISIIRDHEKVMDLFVPDFHGQVIVWQLAADYDRLTGLTYFASWQYGAMTVVDGTEVIDQFPFHGEGAIDMIVDPHRRLIVVANNRAFADSKSPNNISIIDLRNNEVTSIFSAKYSSHVALDPVTGYMYVTNPDDNNVTVLQGKREVATYGTGKKPWAVAVDSVTGYAYVTNAEDNSISLFRDGVPVATIDLPENMGFEPYDVSIDEESGRVYVLNRSSIEKPTYPERQRTVCKQPWVHVLKY